jgi:hypothetical protein
MNLKQIIKAGKTVHSWGEWKSGDIPKKLFPLSKARVKAYKVGKGSRWRIVEFSCIENEFRLNIQINPTKEQFRAWLGILSDRDITLVLRLEFHGTHPGWHVHSVCDDDLDKIPSGVRTGPWWNRFPTPKGRHRKLEFGVTEDSAVDFVNGYLKLYQGGYRLL